MNKYQVVLHLIKKSHAEGEFQYNNLDVAVIEELVEKATPKKLIVETITGSFDDGDFGGTFEYDKVTCPSCAGILLDKSEGVELEIYDYCPYCGQALDLNCSQELKLDWSGENE